MQKTNLLSEPDLVLVDQIKAGSPLAEDSLVVLAERHSGLISSMIKCYCPSGHRSELFGSKLLLVFNAAHKFDEDKSNGCKFSSFLGNEIRFAALNQAYAKEMCEVPCEAPVIEIAFKNNDCYDFLEVDESDFINNIIRTEIDLLQDERARKIFMLRYFSRERKNLSWEKVAEQVELSVQGCIDIHSKNVEIIRKNIKKKYGKESLV